MDSLRLKNYYLDYIKMNRKTSVEDIKTNIMAHLDHTLDDNHICDSNCCYKKRIDEDETISVNKKAAKTNEW